MAGSLGEDSLIVSCAQLGVAGNAKSEGGARLRYESEGGALVHRGRGAIARLLELYGGALRSERTEPWNPYVFTSIDDPRLDEIMCRNL